MITKERKEELVSDIASELIEKVWMEVDIEELETFEEIEIALRSLVRATAKTIAINLVTSPVAENLEGNLIEEWVDLFRNEIYRALEEHSEEEREHGKEKSD